MMRRSFLGSPMASAWAFAIFTVSPAIGAAIAIMIALLP